jgi:hypothetical protein
MPPLDLLRTPVCYMDHSGRWPMLPSCSSQVQHADMLGGKQPFAAGAKPWVSFIEAVVRRR